MKMSEDPIFLYPIPYLKYVLRGYYIIPSIVTDEPARPTEILIRLHYACCTTLHYN